LSFVIASIPSFKGNVNLIKFMLFGRMTYLINGFSNPIIYALLNKKFRRHIMYIFCCRKMGLFNSRVNHLVWDIYVALPCIYKNWRNCWDIFYFLRNWLKDQNNMQTTDKYNFKKSVN
jgi:hypothetical protein